jgi:hypothetical protein
MPKGKTEVLSVRIEPSIKTALQVAADQERRSMAKMLEVMILAWCQENGVAVPRGQPNPPGVDPK